MSYEIRLTSNFKKDYKHLKKRFPMSMGAVDDIITEIENGNLLGEEYNNLGLQEGRHVYKVRIANVQSNKGKSGGFRLIYYAVLDDKRVLLLSIYSKTEISNIKQRQIKELIKQYGQ